MYKAKRPNRQNIFPSPGVIFHFPPSWLFIRYCYLSGPDLNTSLVFWFNPLAVLMLEDSFMNLDPYGPVLAPILQKILYLTHCLHNFSIYIHLILPSIFSNFNIQANDPHSLSLSSLSCSLYSMSFPQPHLSCSLQGPILQPSLPVTSCLLNQNSKLTFL